MDFVRKFALPLAGIGLAACQPPAADNYAERAPEAPHREAPMAPIDSPDTENAIWSPVKGGSRIVYGTPGKTPLLALACVADGQRRTVRVTRFVTADPEAAAIMAITGNGHRARLPVPAVWNGHGWLWEASYPAALPDLDVFTGMRAIELTVPGAGTVSLNPSPLPGQLIEDCRSNSQPGPPPDRPASPASGPGA